MDGEEKVGRGGYPLFSQTFTDNILYTFFTFINTLAKLALVDLSGDKSLFVFGGFAVQVGGKHPFEQLAVG